MKIISTILVTIIYFITTQSALATNSTEVQKIFKANCFQCHGSPLYPAEGGFDYILDFKKLKQSDLLDLNNPENSLIYKYVKSGKMPYKMPPLSQKEIQTILHWITDGAPESEEVIPVVSYPESRLVEAIAIDLQTLSADERKDVRYLTYAHFGNKKNSEDIVTIENAISKLINSLSWSNTIFTPQKISGLPILKINLKQLGWKKNNWEGLTVLDPFAIGSLDAKFTLLTKLTESNSPILRADFFISTASKPPFYYRFLDLNSTESQLLAKLGLSLDPFASSKIIRAGMRGSEFSDGSKVSFNNRVIERRQTSYGYYWKSYDFRSSVGLNNIFLNPLGPHSGEYSYTPAGGEIIFSLPNGFQAYFLINELGQRLDEAPTDVVVDNTRPDGKIINGISCMSCHSEGMRVHSDQVRAFSIANKEKYNDSAFNKIMSLYVEGKDLQNYFEADSNIFRSAMKSIHIDSSSIAKEPVRAIVDLFEGIINFNSAAQELGVTPQDLEAINDKKIKIILDELKFQGLTRLQFNSVYKDIRSNLKN